MSQTEERLIGFLHTLGLRRQRLAGKQSRVQDHDHAHAHAIFQISTLNAIMEGAYDGALTIGELRQQGDFGLGTFNALDGEMIVVDGVVYQALVNGQVRQAADDELTPFAVVQFFASEWQTSVDGPLAFETLPGFLGAHLPSNNYFYALRIDGRFDAVRARSVARQSKPYPPLVEVTQHQQVFDFRDLDGTIVGFRFPDYAQGVNMPGWHLHFINARRRHGGHVLDFTLSEGKIGVDHTGDFYMELPQTQAFAQADLDKDQSGAIERAEALAPENLTASCMSHLSIAPSAFKDVR